MTGDSRSTSAARSPTSCCSTPPAARSSSTRRSPRPSAPLDGGAARRRRAARQGRRAAQRHHGADRARHDADHERADRGQDRPRRPGHHRRLRRHAADPRRAPLRHVRPADRVPGAADPARPHVRDRRAGRPPRATSSSSPSGAALDALAAELAAAKVESVAVCFLNAYVNPANERIVADHLRAELGVPVCISGEVSPQIREYPRMVTTACNAATMPVIGPYLDELQKWLSAAGFGGSVLMMLSNGGVVSADDAARFPIRLVESGPAAGALAGTWFARRMGEDRLLCFDMGGTTAKACLIEHGEPDLTNTFEVARIYRFKKGSGFPVSVPSVDLVEIGAGGGSLARVDQFGLLKVGPESSGADPGPASYGRGGTRAGGHRRRRRARPARPGRLPRRRHAARRIARRAAPCGSVADKLGARRRRHRVGRPRGRQPEHVRGGADARRRAGCRPARRAAARVRRRRPGARLRRRRAARVVAGRVPGQRQRARRRSARSSRRCASTSPARWCATSTASTRPSATRCSSDLRAEGRRVLLAAGVPADAVRFRYGADVRYTGQGNEVTVWLPADEADIDVWPATAGELRERVRVGVPADLRAHDPRRRPAGRHVAPFGGVGGRRVRADARAPPVAAPRPPVAGRSCSSAASRPATSTSTSARRSAPATRSTARRSSRSARRRSSSALAGTSKSPATAV